MSDPVRQAKIEGLRSTSPEDTAADAARQMRDLDVAVLPVADGGRMVGFITYRDLILRVMAEGKDPERVLVGDIATTFPVEVTPDRRLSEAYDLMGRRQVGRQTMAKSDITGGIIYLEDAEADPSEPTVTDTVPGEVATPSRPPAPRWVHTLGELLSTRRTRRWYRRVRWHRRPGWAARTEQDPAESDISLVATGNHDLDLGLWSVDGPANVYTLALAGDPSAGVVTRFPSAGFVDAAGNPVSSETLPRGRYWAVLYAGHGAELMPVCKVPFRIWKGRSRFWPPHERRFIEAWKRRYGGSVPGSQES
jgi:CBS domain-containing protein